MEQARLGARTVGAMQHIWPLLDPLDLDGSFDRWFAAANPLLQAKHAESSQLAANYMRLFKSIEVSGGSSVPIALAERLAAEQAATSLLVTGPHRIKQAMTAGIHIVQATETAFATSSSSGMRLVLNGGRDTTLRTLKADNQAYGWQRITSGKACSFCIMLAGRGAVYKESTVGFSSHDKCACAAAPVYR